MQLDLSLEHLTWDNTFSASLQRTRTAGNLVAVIPSVKRHAITVREQFASLGAYQAGDSFFYIADALVPPDFRPIKPGDKLTPLKPGLAIPDELDDVYTVLTVEGGRRDGLRTQKWKLNARNLKIHYDLRDLISIETPIFSLDAAAARVGGAWEVKYSNLPAKVQLLSQAEAEERGLRGGKGTYEIIIDRDVVVESGKDRIPWQGGYLQITGYHDSSSISELPKITAESVP